MELNFSQTLKPCQAPFSIQRILRRAKSRFNDPMDIKQIRKANMRKLMAGEKSQLAFAAKVGTNPAYLSQILSDKTKANVGDELARNIELAYMLEHGWMDNPHEAKPDASEAPTALSAMWELLTPEQQNDFIGQIQKQVDENRAIYEKFAPKDVEKRTVGFRERSRQMSGKPLITDRRKKNA